MLVITDGMDNSSKRFSQRQTSLKIKDQESTYNWQVVFLASNLDVYGVGNSMGMDRCKTSAFAQDCKGDFTSKMASISACTSIYRESSKTTEPRKLDITVTKPQ